jgi:hypothetical protein
MLNMYFLKMRLVVEKIEIKDLLTSIILRTFSVTSLKRPYSGDFGEKRGAFEDDSKKARSQFHMVYFDALPQFPYSFVIVKFSLMQYSYIISSLVICLVPSAEQ